MEIRNFNDDILKNFDIEKLQYAVDNDIINLAYVREQCEMSKRKEILDKHINSIWYSEKADAWFTHLPDDSAPDKRRKVRRKSKEDLLNYIVGFYKSAEKGYDALTVEKLYCEFMQYKTKSVESGTIKRMAADWKKFYQPEKDFISKPVDKLTKIDIDIFLNDMISKNPMKKHGFYRVCGVLKQMLEYAVEANYIPASPYRLKVNKKKFVPNKKKPGTIETYQENEKQSILAEMERRITNNPSNTAPLAVMLDFELGVRKGELLALRKSDIRGNQIHIQRELVEQFDTSDISNIKCLGYKAVDYTKSECGDRWIPLSERALTIISRVEKINKKYGHSYEDFIFVRGNYHLHPDAIDAQVKRGCEYTGMERVKTMHKIRKTYASTLNKRGVDTAIIAEMLGHADEATTMRYYIFNTENEESTHKIVLDALQHDKPEKRTKEDQKIIPFPIREKKGKSL